MKEKDTSYYAMDMTTLAFEQTNKRMFMLCVLLIVLLLSTNIGWLIYETQFEDVVETTTIDAEQTAEGNSSNTIVGGNYGGETESTDYEN